MVHSFLENGYDLQMFKSSEVLDLKSSNFSNKSYILGIGKCFLLILLFSSLKSERKRRVPLNLGIIKVKASHSVFFYILRQLFLLIY